MLAFRSVQQGNHCAREEFLYELKAGQSVTGVPASLTTYARARAARIAAMLALPVALLLTTSSQQQPN
jgi:hypothetical protein